MAVNCNYSSNFSGNFLCPLPIGNLLFLFTNYIFCSIHKIFQKQTSFSHMSRLWIDFIRELELLPSMWYKNLKCIQVLGWKRKEQSLPPKTSVTLQGPKVNLQTCKSYETIYAYIYSSQKYCNILACAMNNILLHNRAVLTGETHTQYRDSISVIDSFGINILYRRHNKHDFFSV